MKTRKFVYAEIGSISHGTMRKEDLIPEFIYTLKDLATKNHNRKHLAMVKRIQKCIDDSDRQDHRTKFNQDNPYFNSEDSDYDLNEDLFNALNEYALPYFYFGSHPGDGSDYGYWLSEDFETEFNQWDNLKVSDTSEVPAKYNGEVLHVNDHGNCTLYSAKNGKLTEIWSIV